MKINITFEGSGTETGDKSQAKNKRRVSKKGDWRGKGKSLQTTGMET